MSYFVFNRFSGNFIVELESHEAYILAMFPSSDFNVVISHHGY